MHFYLCFYECNIKRYTTNTFNVPGASDIDQDNDYHELNQETTEVVHQSTSSQSNKGMKLACRIFHTVGSVLTVGFFLKSMPVLWKTPMIKIVLDTNNTCTCVYIHMCVKFNQTQPKQVKKT